MLGYCLVFAMLSAVIVVGALAAAQRRSTWPRVGAWVLGGGGVLVAASFLVDPWMALLGGAALLTTGLVLGVRLGAEVQQAAHLWPLAVVALGADVWSVTSPEGVTRQVVESGPSGVMHFVVLALPVPGVELSPILGVGDVLFTGLLVGAVVRLGLSQRRVLVGLLTGFACCLVGLLVIQLPIPALPFLAVGGVAALGRQATPHRRELGLAVGFVVVFFLVRGLLV